MTEAVDKTDQSAVDLSFIHAVRVLQRRLPQVGAIPPKHHRGWIDSILMEISSYREITSRGKRKVRGVKKRTSNYGARQKEDPINQPCIPVLRMFIN